MKAIWETNREMRQTESNKVKEELSENVEETKVKDDDTNLLDLQNMKATDLKNNKRVIIQRTDDDEADIKRSYLKDALKDVFLNYRKEHCDQFGNIIENNLDVKQQETIRKLKTKIQNEELVCYTTDKTGNLVLDTIENYSNKLSKHIKEDDIINDKKVKSVEQYRFGCLP